MSSVTMLNHELLRNQNSRSLSSSLVTAFTWSAVGEPRHPPSNTLYVSVEGPKLIPGCPPAENRKCSAKFQLVKRMISMLEVSNTDEPKTDCRPFRKSAGARSWPVGLLAAYGHNFDFADLQSFVECALHSSVPAWQHKKWLGCVFYQDSARSS